MQGEKASIFTAEQEKGLHALKAYFPYRIVFGCVNNNGDFEQYADHTRQRLNDKIRKGWLCATIS